MFKKFRESSSAAFLRDSIILINSGGIAGILYLLVHVVTGRWMDPIAYSVLVSMLGLLSVLSVPASAIRAVLARYVAQHSEEDTPQIWVTIVRRATRKIVIFGGGALIVWILLSPLTRDVLLAPSANVVIVLGVIALASLVKPVIAGTLQGASLFGWLAASAVGAAAARLLFVGIVAYYCSNVTYMMIATFFSTLFGLAVGYWPFRNILRTTPSVPSLDSKPMYAYFWPVLLSQVSLHFLLNLDIILLTRFLSGEDLKVYGKVAMLSRTLLYLAQPVATVMFPRAVKSKNAKLLFGPMALTFVISLAGALLLTIAPNVLIRLMYDVEGPQYGSLARVYVWAALPATLLSLVANYMWARDMTMQSLVVVPMLVLYVIGLCFFHHTPLQIIACFGVFGWLALAILCAVCFKAQRTAARVAS